MAQCWAGRVNSAWVLSSGSCAVSDGSHGLGRVSPARRIVRNCIALREAAGNRTDEREVCIDLLVCFRFY